MKGAFIEGDMLGVVLSLRTMSDETIPREIFGVGFQDCRIAGTRWIFGNTSNGSAIQADWLDATFGDASVILTEDMDRPAHWPDWELPSGGTTVSISNGASGRLIPQSMRRRLPPQPDRVTHISVNRKKSGMSLVRNIFVSGRKMTIGQGPALHLTGRCDNQ